MSAETWVPIYEKDGNEFFVVAESFVGASEEEARTIGLGTMLVECILLGMKYRRVQQIDVKHTPHVPADFGGASVAIIAGPVFDVHAAHYAAQGGAA